ncbi:MAG: DNA-binding protein [Clostridia bacterium]|nr:DNA-binding protein [Clostridia bacterium]
MERRVAANLLLDFYGALLTEHTREILRMYLEEDMSLQEIADTLSISRQAVHDALTRGEKQLSEYEDKLGLLRRFRDMKLRLAECTRLLETAKDALSKAEALLNGIEADSDA